MNKLLGDTEWIWDESDLPEGSDEDEYQYYADSQLSLLAEMSAELSSPGIMDNHWEYGIAMGYVGWDEFIWPYRSTRSRFCIFEIHGI